MVNITLLGEQSVVDPVTERTLTLSVSYTHLTLPTN